jgi:hypothetical protein
LRFADQAISVRGQLISRFLADALELLALFRRLELLILHAPFFCNRIAQDRVNVSRTAWKYLFDLFESWVHVVS